MASTHQMLLAMGLKKESPASSPASSLLSCSKDKEFPENQHQASLAYALNACLNPDLNLDHTPLT